MKNALKRKKNCITLNNMVIFVATIQDEITQSQRVKVIYDHPFYVSCGL